MISMYVSMHLSYLSMYLCIYMYLCCIAYIHVLMYPCICASMYLSMYPCICVPINGPPIKVTKSLEVWSGGASVRLHGLHGRLHGWRGFARNWNCEGALRHTCQLWRSPAAHFPTVVSHQCEWCMHSHSSCILHCRGILYGWVCYFYVVFIFILGPWAMGQESKRDPH